MFDVCLKIHRDSQDGRVKHLQTKLKGFMVGQEREKEENKRGVTFVVSTSHNNQHKQHQNHHKCQNKIFKRKYLDLCFKMHMYLHL